MVQQAKSGLTLVGLVAIVDPPRPEIPGVIRTLRGAGIRIFMVRGSSIPFQFLAAIATYMFLDPYTPGQVTGDFALTATAIAAECGIMTASTVDTISALSRSGTAAESKPLDGNKDRDDEAPAPSSLVLSGPELITLSPAQ